MLFSASGLSSIEILFLKKSSVEVCLSVEKSVWVKMCAITVVTATINCNGRQSTKLNQKLGTIFERFKSCPPDLSTVPWKNQTSCISQLLCVLQMLFHLGLYFSKWHPGTFDGSQPTCSVQLQCSSRCWWPTLAEKKSVISCTAKKQRDRETEELLEMAREVFCYRKWITWPELQFRELEIHTRWKRPVCARAELGKWQLKLLR